MNIFFATDDLRELCLSEAKAKKLLGKAGLKKLKARYSDLMAARRVTDLVAGRPHPLKGDRAGQYSLRLDGGYRLVFEAANNPVPENGDGSIDWSQVTAIRIVYLGDYHD